MDLLNKDQAIEVLTHFVEMKHPVMVWGYYTDNIRYVVSQTATILGKSHKHFDTYSFDAYTLDLFKKSLFSASPENRIFNMENIVESTKAVKPSLYQMIFDKQFSSEGRTIFVPDSSFVIGSSLVGENKKMTTMERLLHNHMAHLYVE